MRYTDIFSGKIQGSVLRKNKFEKPFFHSFFLLIFAAMPVMVNASPLIREPEDSELIVRWSSAELRPQVLSPELIKQEIFHHFSLAALPGQSWRYDRVHQQLMVLGDDPQAASADLKYIRARLLQHRHRFAEAAELLLGVDPQSEFYVSSRLLLAQVNTELGYSAKANSACAGLFLLAPDLALGCTFASGFQNDDVRGPFLDRLIEQYSKAGNPDSDALLYWFMYQKARHLMAAEAYRAVSALYQRYASAEALSVADLVIYSEALLRSGNAGEVLALLQPFMSTLHPDDALIVQLARAESMQALPGTYWRDFARQRIDERIRRQDRGYDELIALYHATLRENPSAGLVQLQNGLASVGRVVP